MAANMKQLLEAGVHFETWTRRWNPKMREYIFAERNRIHIIDLAQTVSRLDAALSSFARRRGAANRFCSSARRSRPERQSTRKRLAPDWRYYVWTPVGSVAYTRTS